ncbi:PAS domain-containing hybrid sensor histidine kinase/response regulator [Enterorhabdus sp. P55]|uniref:PAS domain-containing hybrid sensor histidine kinase/response regulator n=1 Tax=Enterorhabdus sp. P55 TaxID=2304571 RepID=UPI00136E51A2|nr:ATP-binding protein [Enterorhabdus sp. P55]NBI31974.1 response regulator [Enterorhabdus sp. P55]
MYHSLLRIHLIGFDADMADVVEKTAPPTSFTRQVTASPALGAASADDPAVSQADGLFLRVVDEDSLAAVEPLLAARKPGADLVLIAPNDLAAAAEPFLGQLTDLWADPLSPATLAFHFARWQRARKDAADAWETAQYLEATINSIPCLIWYKTADGVHEKVNDSFCETVGKTKEQVQGQRHAYIWDVEEDDPACIESERIVMETERTCVSEECVQTGSDTRLLTTYKSPLYNPDGTVMGTVGVGIDITQERAYEASLVEKTRTLETIFTTMECGVLTHSIDGSRILGINQAALNILGYESEAELMDQGFDMIAPTVVEEDQAMLRERIATLTHIGDSVSTEYRVRRSTGEILHVMGNIKLTEKDGERYFQRFLLDITEQKLEEERKERHQRDLLKALSEDYLVVCAYDLDTDVSEPVRVSTDPALGLANVFGEGLTLEESGGRYISERVHESDRAKMADVLSPARILEHLETDDRLDALYRTGQGDEAQFCQVTIVRAGSWDDGHRIVMGLRNVDRQIREELQQKELLEEALVRANKASEAKSAFLTNMSHDIRTPMNAIVGFTTLATNHIDQKDRVEEYLAKIQASSHHLLSLINDILDMSRIESGKASLDEQRSSIHEIMENLHTILQPEADERGITLKVDAGPEAEVPIICDKLKINQIFLNLLGNSLKFTAPEGVVSATVAEAPGAPAGCRRYRMVVEDTGIGMSPEFLKHIFDPFERERTSTISGIQGTGLGMAITKSLVDMMGGTIEVASTEGVGSRFTVMLTLREADASGDLAPTAPTRVVPSDALKGCHVLLVDDNLLNREIALTLLEDAGFEVECAVDGQMAVDMMAEPDADRFELVLMDIQMPVMNGYEAARAIRALEGPAATVPILAITADAFDTDRQKALDAGMDGHLPKPIEVDKLFAALDALLA